MGCTVGLNEAVIADDTHLLSPRPIAIKLMSYTEGQKGDL